jgi:uncharacterized protein YkwD
VTTRFDLSSKESTMPDPTNPSLIDALNAARTANNLGVLTEDPRLTESAQGWACAMAVSENLSHGDFSARLQNAVGQVAGGECVAEGQTDASAAVQAWLDDPPHRAIMLGDFDSVGAGMLPSGKGTMYWCADFAKLSAGSRVGSAMSP